ncbi:MAG: alpha/beta hydrolase [Polyangiaceae bacterium]
MRPIELHHGELTFSTLEAAPTGAGRGETVLLLHGFPDHARSFRAQLPALAAAGYRAVAPTLRGYEPSSQPRDRDYHLDAIARDVFAFADELGVERFHLVGHDWGALVGYVAAALHGDRLASLTTLAVPHPGRLVREGLFRVPRQIRLSSYVLFFQLRGVAEFALERDDWAMLERLWRDWSPGWTVPSEELALLKRTFAQPGVKRAALAYYRANFDVLSRQGRAVGALLRARVEAPTLALTGALDGCMDSRLHDLVMHADDFPRGVTVARVEGAGHFLHQEKPERVNAELLAWLEAHPALG